MQVRPIDPEAHAAVFNAGACFSIENWFETIRLYHVEPTETVPLEFRAEILDGPMRAYFVKVTAFGGVPTHYRIEFLTSAWQWSFRESHVTPSLEEAWAALLLAEDHHHG